MTALPVIFSVKKYADRLTQVAQRKDIHVNFRRNLVKVDGDRRLATFENLETGDREDYEVC